MGVPTAETPPRGLDAEWLGNWRGALKVLKERGTWHPALKPVLDEYIEALRAAQRAREMGEGWDRHAKRALAFAVELGLTPKARRAAELKGEGADDGDEDGFGALDELEPRRKARAKAS